MPSFAVNVKALAELVGRSPGVIERIAARPGWPLEVCQGERKLYGVPTWWLRREIARADECSALEWLKEMRDLVDFRSRFRFHTTPFTRELPTEQRFRLPQFDRALRGLVDVVDSRQSG